MRFCAMAFSSVVLTCSWLTTSLNDWGRYLRAITWYMGWVSGSSTDQYARPRVIRGTRTAPLPLLPSGPGGVCGRPLHGARDLTSIYRSTRAGEDRFARKLTRGTRSESVAAGRGWENGRGYVRWRFGWIRSRRGCCESAACRPPGQSRQSSHRSAIGPVVPGGTRRVCGHGGEASAGPEGGP